MISQLLLQRVNDQADTRQADVVKLVIQRLSEPEKPKKTGFDPFFEPSVINHRFEYRAPTLKGQMAYVQYVDTLVEYTKLSKMFHRAEKREDLYTEWTPLGGGIPIRPLERIRKQLEECRKKKEDLKRILLAEDPWFDLKACNKEVNARVSDWTYTRSW